MSEITKKPIKVSIEFIVKPSYWKGWPPGKTPTTKKKLEAEIRSWIEDSDIPVKKFSVRY